MTKNNKRHILYLTHIVKELIARGNFQEACLLGRFIENKDEDTLRTLSTKFKRIFNDDDIKEMARVVRSITNKYIPPNMRGVVEQEAEFIAEMRGKLLPFKKPSRKSCE